MNLDNYVSFVVLFDIDESKIILVQDSDKSGKQYWKFPGGTWHIQDRSPLVTAKREIKEEVPQVNFTTPLYLVKNYHIKKPNPHNFYLFYAEVKKNSQLKPVSNEIGRIEEFSLTKAREIANSGEMLEQHAKALDDFVDFVLSH